MRSWHLSVAFSISVGEALVTYRSRASAIPSPHYALRAAPSGGQAPALEMDRETIDSHLPARHAGGGQAPALRLYMPFLSSSAGLQPASDQGQRTTGLHCRHTRPKGSLPPFRAVCPALETERETIDSALPARHAGGGQAPALRFVSCLKCRAARNLVHSLKVPRCVRYG